MTNSVVMQLLDTIQGSIFLAILSTMGSFQYHNPDLAQSKIEVIREGNSVIILLADKNDFANTQNILGVRLESKEELNPQDISNLWSHRDKIQLMGRIQGSSFLFIKKAVEVFQQYNPDLTGYNIEVVREGDSIGVIFADKDRPTGTLGSVGKSGFEVELNAQDLTVIRSNFVR